MIFVKIALDAFDQHRAALPAADANRCHAAPSAGALQHVEKMQHDARAGSTHGMTDRDRATIDIELVAIELAQWRIQTELALAVVRAFPGSLACNHLRCKRLVDFPCIDIVETEAMTLQDGCCRLHGAKPHLCRVE